MSIRLLLTPVAAALILATALLPATSAVPAFTSFVPLSGQEEVPVRATPASGTAVFSLNTDGTRIHYRIFVQNLRNVTAAHIHVGARGVNGPVVVFLFGPSPAGSGLRSGVLASGSFTAADLIGPLRGRPLSDLLAALQAGTAYVNVHTDDGVAPTNTGPGDFPGGELRGQFGQGDRRPRI